MELNAPREGHFSNTHMEQRGVLGTVSRRTRAWNRKGKEGEEGGEGREGSGGGREGPTLKTQAETRVLAPLSSSPPPLPKHTHPGSHFHLPFTSSARILVCSAPKSSTPQVHKEAPVGQYDMEKTFNSEEVQEAGLGPRSRCLWGRLWGRLQPVLEKRQKEPGQEVPPWKV